MIRMRNGSWLVLLAPLLAAPANAQQGAPRVVMNELPSAAFSENWSNPFPEAVMAAGPAREMGNARIALEFYDRMINRKDFEAASQLLGPNYNQHDVALENGAEGLRQYIAGLTQRTPQASVQVKRALTDGEYVILHSHLKDSPDALGAIAGDIFRLENGRIVERWSIVHPIPQNPSSLNPHGAFRGRDDGSRRD